MERTLNEYINRARVITDNNTRGNITKHERQKIKNELKHMLYNVEKVYNFIKNTVETINSIGSEKILNKLDKTQSKDKIKSAKEITQNNILPHISNDLYWCNDINQYCIKIGNLYLYGNIGNVYDKKILQNDCIKAHQVIPCVAKNNCRNVLSLKYCKFWHDPKDLIILKNSKIITNEYYHSTIKLTRNFSNTSWIYTSDIKNRNNCNVRHIGNKATLNNDIALCKISDIYKSEIINLKSQVIHDLLILLKLNEAGLA
ncbi:MAG: hypothetical protein ACRCZI_01070 [Cetobacterium sp.]